MSFLELYLVVVLVPGVNDVAEVIAVLLFVGGIVVGAIGGGAITIEDEWDQFGAGLRRVIKWWLICVAVSGGIGLAAPSDEELAKMIGGYVVTNVQGIEQLPENLVKYANEFLEGGAESE